MAGSSRGPVWFGLAYATLVGAAFVVALQPTGGATGGLAATILGLPWTAVSVFLFDANDPGLVDRLGPAVALIGGLINAYLVYLIARRALRREA